MPIKEEDRLFLNKNEAELWKAAVVASLRSHDPMSTISGALASIGTADDVVQAYRARAQVGEDQLRKALRPYAPPWMELSAFVKKVKIASLNLHEKNADGANGKIPAIKELRTTAGLGLKEAKEAIETFQRIQDG